LKVAGLSLDLSYFFDKVQSPEDIEECVEKMIVSGERPTAIFCMEDILAISLIRSLQKHGLRVPEDISVVSIDDIILSSRVYPALTTVALDKDALGSYAVDLLMDLVNGKDSKSITVSSNNLVVRESVKPLDAK
jgi:DNA-binding LacI/PurR family transcriptional regulator